MLLVCLLMTLAMTTHLYIVTYVIRSLLPCKDPSVVTPSHSISFASLHLKHLVKVSYLFFFFYAEFSEFQMQSPGHVKNRVKHRITGDHADSLENGPSNYQSFGSLEPSWTPSSASPPTSMAHYFPPILTFFYLLFFKDSIF